MIAPRFGVRDAADPEDAGVLVGDEVAPVDDMVLIAEEKEEVVVVDSMLSDTRVVGVLPGVVSDTVA
jgi:hypothetical protein